MIYRVRILNFEHLLFPCLGYGKSRMESDVLLETNRENVVANFRYHLLHRAETTNDIMEVDVFDFV
jgi:hypothetical protein